MRPTEIDEALRMLDELSDPPGDDLTRGEPGTADALAVARLLAAALEKVPDWVWDHKCCPPGESCCMCG